MRVIARRAAQKIGRANTREARTFRRHPSTPLTVTLTPPKRHPLRKRGSSACIYGGLMPKKAIIRPVHAPSLR